MKFMLSQLLVAACFVAVRCASPTDGAHGMQAVKCFGNACKDALPARCRTALVGAQFDMP